MGKPRHDSVAANLKKSNMPQKNSFWDTKLSTETPHLLDGANIITTIFLKYTDIIIRDSSLSCIYDYQSKQWCFSFY